MNSSLTPALRHQAVAGHISQDQTQSCGLASCPMEELRQGHSEVDSHRLQTWGTRAALASGVPARVAKVGPYAQGTSCSLLASVLKVQKAPRPMMPWGWYCPKAMVLLVSKLCVFTSCRKTLGQSKLARRVLGNTPGWKHWACPAPRAWV